ncbi:MAG: metallophosphoesterase family protein [Burkholderiales bacterium]|nr:metallophosphoesterase family protein [Burkholderiales bacterium]
MLLAILTDLHANREALTACLDDAATFSPDRYVFLGDYVGYGADPAWVVETVMHHVEWGAVAVVGNHDLAALGADSSMMVADARSAGAWTAAQLSPAHRDFLGAMPLTAELDGCLFVHANPWHPAGWEYVLNGADAARALYAVPHAYVFCGHNHSPALYNLSSIGKMGHFQPIPGEAIPLAPHRRWLALPGSVGQPRDGNSAACYALFDTTQHTLTFRRVPYDIDAAAERIRAAGLPKALADRLHFGV